MKNENQTESSSITLSDSLKNLIKSPHTYYAIAKGVGAYSLGFGNSNSELPFYVALSGALEFMQAYLKSSIPALNVKFSSKLMQIINKSPMEIYLPSYIYLIFKTFFTGKDALENLIDKETK